MRSHDSSVQLDQPKKCLFCNAGDTPSNPIHKCYILQLKEVDDHTQDEFNELYDLLENWEDVRVWRRAFVACHAMNMIWLCQHHHTDFDQYKFSLIVNPLHRTVSFTSLCPEYDNQVTRANDHIKDLNLSILSNRAISMRMEEALKSGSLFQGKIGVDYVHWENLRDFSINGSERSNDSEDEEASER